MDRISIERLTTAKILTVNLGGTAKFNIFLANNQVFGYACVGAFLVTASF